MHPFYFIYLSDPKTLNCRCIKYQIKWQKKNTFQCIVQYIDDELVKMTKEKKYIIFWFSNISVNVHCFYNGSDVRRMGLNQKLKLVATLLMPLCLI